MLGSEGMQLRDGSKCGKPQSQTCTHAGTHRNTEHTHACTPTHQTHLHTYFTHIHTHTSTFPCLSTLSHSTQKVYEPPRAYLQDTCWPPWGAGLCFSQPLCPTPGDPSAFHPRFPSELVQHFLHLSLEGPKFKGATRPQNNSISDTRTI